ncbi:MAG: hypothetical protein Q9163_005294 [Psora crenata]
MGLTFNMQEYEKLASLRERRIRREDIVKGNHPEREQEQEVITDIFGVDLDVIGPPNGNCPIKLPGFYQSYLLIKPHPSLRVLFASPELQDAGATQKPFSSLICASEKVQAHLAKALEVGRKVTAKVAWLPGGGERGKLRWIHCTPLLGVNDAVGVWVVIVVDAEKDDSEEDNKPTPPPGGSIMQLSSTYNAAAIPWDMDRHLVSSTESSIRSSKEKVPEKERLSRRTNRSRGSEPGPSREHGSSKLRSPDRKPAASSQLPRQSDDLGSSRATASSNSSVYEGNSYRPSSQRSSIAPVHSPLLPKIEFLGRKSTDEDSSKRKPAKLPGNSAPEEKAASQWPPVRKTYKSLSPYGVLFQDQEQVRM